MADVYTGERGNVNFKTLFILQYTSHVPTKFALINLSIPVDMLYDLTIILSRLIDYRYFYRTGISIVILYHKTFIYCGWDQLTFPIAHMSTMSFDDFDINDSVDLFCV